MAYNFKIGNVFSLDGRLCIVSSITEEGTVFWISLTSENSLGATPKIGWTTTFTCGCSGFPEDECDICNNTGIGTSTTLGIDDAVFIATSVKSYIEQTLLKNFNF